MFSLHTLTLYTFCIFTRVFVYLVALTTYLVLRVLFPVSCTMTLVSCTASPVSGTSLLVSRTSFPVHVLPEIGIPRLKTDSEVAVTALSEGFSPLAVLTLRLESLPYQRADTRLSRFPVVC